MAVNALSEIQRKWEQLELALEEDQLDQSSQTELRSFLEECIDAGQHVVSQVDRDRLQSIARDVGDRIFWATKEYLSVTIKPPRSNPDVEVISITVPAHNLPYQRNPFFTDRDDIIEELHQRFFEQRITGKSAIEVVSGLGGIGKTQTAIEYAYRHFDEYEYIFFVNANSDEEIRSCLREIAKRLQLNLSDESGWEQVTHAVKMWLVSRRKWLLIIDDAEDIALISPILPSSLPGHVILTSRKTVFDTLGIAKPIKMPVLSPEESIEFLFKRTSRDDTDDDEHKAASQLVAELGFLPLAMEQAGAYINEQKSRFQDYLKSYRKRGLSLLGLSLPVFGSRRSSVSDTWRINFEAVEKTSVASADLLYLSAFLNPNAIPIELIVKGHSELGHNLAQALVDIRDDPLVLDNLLNPLNDYSLIRRDPGSNTYSIHHLVQEVLQDRMGSSTRALWAERAVRVLSQVFPKVEYENWPLCELLLPHAKIAADLVKNYQLDSEAAAFLLNQAGRYLYKRAQYYEAESLISQALELRKRLPEQGNPDIAASLTDLARVYRGQGRNHEAEPLYLKALELRRQQLGEEHPEVIASLYNLARLYYYQARYEEAEALQQQALESRRRQLDEGDKDDNIDVADSLNSLARLYEAQGRYEDAQPLYQEALNLRQDFLGENHPDVATSLDNLASLYEAQGRYGEAEPIYKKALTLRQNALGEEHTDVAASLNNLADIYTLQANYDRAERLYQKSLKLRRKLLGETHPAIAQNLSNLARLYDARGRFRDAESLFKEALKIYKKLGTDHPDLAEILNNLADLYRVKGRYEEAEILYEDALELRGRLLGENHPDIAESLDDLARLYRYQGRFDKAESFYLRSIELSKHLLGDEHPEVARRLNNLARLYFFQGRNDEAEPLFIQVLALRKRIFAEEHPDVATSLNNLALLRVAQDRYDEAESLHRQALEIREKSAWGGASRSRR
ncbi:MAG: tetratricopeptide repeat protein [Leptolyngbya sp. SIOISBB]|nr:tetratricopeptide repeat protein [Leptolyngbya sp. SIOISBB]